MVKSNLEEEERLVLWRRYKNSPAFMTKATNGIKKKIGKKKHDVKWRMPSATKKVYVKL